MGKSSAAEQYERLYAKTRKEMGGMFDAPTLKQVLPGRAEQLKKLYQQAYGESHAGFKGVKNPALFGKKPHQKHANECGYMAGLQGYPPEVPHVWRGTWAPDAIEAYKVGWATGRRASEMLKRRALKSYGRNPAKYPLKPGDPAWARRTIKPGMLVQISHGSGILSGKQAVVTSPKEVRTDGRGIPTNIQGAYKPVDWKAEVAIRLIGTSELATMYKERLIRLDPEFADAGRNPSGYSEELRAYQEAQTQNRSRRAKGLPLLPVPPKPETPMAWQLFDENGDYIGTAPAGQGKAEAIAAAQAAGYKVGKAAKVLAMHYNPVLSSARRNAEDMPPETAHEEGWNAGYMNFGVEPPSWYKGKELSEFLRGVKDGKADRQAHNLQRDWEDYDKDHGPRPSGARPNPVLSSAPDIESMEVVYRSQPWNSLTSNGWVTDRVVGDKAIMLPPRRNPVGQSGGTCYFCKGKISRREGGIYSLLGELGGPQKKISWCTTCQAKLGDKRVDAKLDALAAKLGKSNPGIDPVSGARMARDAAQRKPNNTAGNGGALFKKILAMKEEEAEKVAGSLVESLPKPVIDRVIGGRYAGTNMQALWALLKDPEAKALLEKAAASPNPRLAGMNEGLYEWGGHQWAIDLESPNGVLLLMGQERNLEGNWATTWVVLHNEKIIAYGVDRAAMERAWIRVAAGSKAKKNPVYPWYAECRKCGFATPHSPRTSEKQMGPCPRCAGTAWKFGSRFADAATYKAPHERHGRVFGPKAKKNPATPSEADIAKIKGFKPEMLKHPDFMPALAKYIEFHGCMPESLTKVNINLGAAAKGETTFLAHMGKAPEVSYQTTNPKSNKAGSRWIHEFCEDMKKKDVKEKDLPDLACTADGKAIITVGGRFEVKDWVRK